MASESGTKPRPTAADRLAHAEKTEGDLMELMHDIGGLIVGGGTLVNCWPPQSLAVEMLLDGTTTKYAKALATAQASLADAVGAVRQFRDLAADLVDREKESPADGAATPKEKADAEYLVRMISSLFPVEMDAFKPVMTAMLRGPVPANTVPELGPNASLAVRVLVKLGQAVAVPSEVLGHCYVLTDAGRELARVAGLAQTKAPSGGAA